MRTNFYLDSRPSRGGESKVVLYVLGIGKRQRIHTSCSIKPENWNKQTQRAYEYGKKSFDGAMDFNEKLNQIKSDVYKIFWKADPKESKEKIKERIKEYFKEDEQEKQLTFFEVYDKYMLRKQKDVSKGTFAKYKTIRNHLKEFEASVKKERYKQTKVPLTFDSFDRTNFYDEFLDFLFDQLGMNNNTAYKTIKFVKTFLYWSEERGFHSNQNYKSYRAKEFKKEVIFLTEDELKRFYEFDFSDQPRYARVRDIFCFGCFSGQRFSDLQRISWNDIRGNIWELRVKKTQQINYIPLNFLTKNILAKYEHEDTPLPRISNQKMNDYLKEALKIAGNDEPVKTTQYKRNEVKTDYKPKYKVVASHTARRTFITLSLQRGMRPETVMKITGHASYRMMQKYMEITKDMQKNEMEEIWGSGFKSKIKSINTN